jgi:N-acetylmuramoyl-L-alanine amidase
MALMLGDRGDAVRDLQHRLGRCGLVIDAAEVGSFGTSTATAVSAFQEQRGLVPTGDCDDHTWSSLVESNYRLGDRPLRISRPLLRGDDILDLQQRLSGLGFDVGWIDGIYGPLTASAVEEFQRNAGLEADQTCGMLTVRQLNVLSQRLVNLHPVASILEAERLRNQPTTLMGRRLIVGHDGGLAQLAHGVARRLRRQGVLVQTVDHADQSQQARAANAFEADVVVSLTDAGQGDSVSFYVTDGFRSQGGERLAHLLGSAFSECELPTLDIIGRRLPILRETRMPAVLIDLSDLADALAHLDAYVEAVTAAISAWVVEPLVG